VANFTRGPWKVAHSGYPNSPFVIFAGDRLPNFQTRFPLSGVNAIAEIFHDESPAHEEQAANASLIAAAPELFDALERLLANDGISNREFARNALAKAVTRG